MSKVALAAIGERRSNVLRSLDLIEEDIESSIDGKNILIKPNMVSTSVQLASTHSGHLEGILKFLETLDVEKVTIAESSPSNTEKGFEEFGYHELKRKFPEIELRFKDLNKDSHESFWVVDREIHPVKVRVAETLLDPDNFVISAARPKTHDTVVATLSLKNVLMGGVINDSINRDKSKMHQGIKQMNYNLFYLSQYLMPDLASIDGYRGMEGDGPIHGDPVEIGVAISSLDPVASDRVGLEMMGIDPEKVGYLHFCGKEGLGEYDLEEIEVLGSDIKNYKKSFKLHSNVERQLKW